MKKVQTLSNCMNLRIHELDLPLLPFRNEWILPSLFRFCWNPKNTFLCLHIIASGRDIEPRRLPNIFFILLYKYFEMNFIDEYSHKSTVFSTTEIKPKTQITIYIENLFWKGDQKISIANLLCWYIPIFILDMELFILFNFCVWFDQSLQKIEIRIWQMAYIFARITIHNMVCFIICFSSFVWFIYEIVSAFGKIPRKF